MSILTQEAFDQFLHNFACSTIDSGPNILTHRFIPCMEYSSELWPSKYHYKYPNHIYNNGQWDGKKYYMQQYDDYENSEHRYITDDPIGDLISAYTSTVDCFNRGSYRDRIMFPNYSSGTDDIFLEFDFKERYDSMYRQQMFGERNEDEARQFYLESVKHNAFLISEMNLAKSRKIGDIVRAQAAFEKFHGYPHGFSTIAINTRDFYPWVLQYGNIHYCEYINSDVDKEKLKITDFYTIIPDNASIDDLINAYEPHKEFIKSIPEKYNLKEYKNTNTIFNKYHKEGINFKTYFNMNVILIAVFSREEFEEAIVDALTYSYYMYSNYKDYIPQCTIPKLLSAYQNISKKRIEQNPNEKQYYERRWANSLIKNPNAKYIVMKVSRSESYKAYWIPSDIEVLCKN